MTDKAKEQACCQRIIDAQGNYMKAMAALQSSIETGGYDHWQDVEKFAKAASEDVRRYAPSALASRPAELQKYASVIYDIETRCMLYNGTTVAREVLGLLESAGYVNARGFTDHPAVTPQPKTEPCTCNAQRDGDMQWTHAPNCPRSESWQRRVAKDASAAEPERCAYIDCTYQRVCGMTREEHADLKAHGLIPNPDHEFVAPTVTHTTTPTEPEGGSDFAERATRNNHGPRVTYHHDANSAVRFARQEDAERIIAWLLEGEPVVAREHGWFRATAAPSDPQPSEQEEEAAFRTWRDQNGLASHRAAFDAGREYERNHRPAIDIEDIIKHCRLLPDAKSVSLPELRKALQKATGG